MSRPEEYVAGARFRVIKEGARLSGMKPMPGYFQGWGVDLHVGDVIETTDWGAGWGSDPGYGIHVKVPGINFAEFRPSGSTYWMIYWPDRSYLEQVANDTPLTDFTERVA